MLDPGEREGLVAPRDDATEQDELILLLQGSGLVADGVDYAVECVGQPSAVRALTAEQRLSEISRMLAGEGSTSESDAAARRLIEEGLAAAQARQKRQA